MRIEVSISRNGQVFGPYPLEELEGLVADGSILPGDMAWTEGLPEWRPLHEIADIEAVTESISSGQSDQLQEGDTELVETAVESGASDNGNSPSVATAPPTVRLRTQACPVCGEQILGVARKCRFCGEFIQSATTGTAIPPPPPTSVNQVPVTLSQRITNLAGVEKLEGFSLKGLFSEVFRHHPAEEVEEYFTVGTSRSTPHIAEVDTSWPRPWVFFRTIVGSLIVYALFYFAWNEFENVNLIPGMIMIGSFAVPLATLIFFLEVNARRNVSLYQVIRLVFLGGIISLMVTLVLSEFIGGLAGWLGASVAGLSEEPSKLLALVSIAGLAKYRYRINGLLFGAAVGAGFAAFESAGYALRIGFAAGSSAMHANIVLRGLLSPFGHIAWTAMTGAALWNVKGGQKFSPSMLFEPRFVRVFLMAVALHMLWNSPLELPFFGKYLALGAVAWTVIFALIQGGLKELAMEKANGSGDAIG